MKRIFLLAILFLAGCGGGGYVPTRLVVATNSPLPDAEIGTKYSVQLVAAGEPGPYQWSMTGTLPPGLTLSKTGLISGTPTQQGTYTITVAVSTASSTWKAVR
jgi:hypothetical protein